TPTREAGPDILSNSASRVSCSRSRRTSTRSRISEANSAEPAAGRTMVGARPKTLKAVAVASAVAVAAAGCGVDAVPSRGTDVDSLPVVPPGTVLLRGAGATFPYLLYDKWFRTYQQGHPSNVVAYQAVGSGEGVRRFIARGVKDEERVDFG